MTYFISYFVKINGVSEGPFTEQELFKKYYGILPCHTPCMQAGNRSWSTLGDIFMEWKDSGAGSSSGAVSNAGVGLYDPPLRARLPGHYPALKFYRKILRFIALVAAVNVAWQLLYGIFNIENADRLVALISSIFEDIVVLVVNLGLAEMITLLLDIEENTRKPAVQQTPPPPPKATSPNA